MPILGQLGVQLLAADSSFRANFVVRLQAVVVVAIVAVPHVRGVLCQRLVRRSVCVVVCPVAVQPVRYTLALAARQRLAARIVVQQRIIHDNRRRNGPIIEDVPLHGDRKLLHSPYDALEQTEQHELPLIDVQLGRIEADAQLAERRTVRHRRKDAKTVADLGLRPAQMLLDGIGFGALLDATLLHCLAFGQQRQLRRRPIDVAVLEHGHDGYNSQQHQMVDALHHQTYATNGNRFKRFDFIEMAV